MKNETTAITAAQIDELGALLKQIKALTKDADKIKNSIKEFASLSGDRRLAGDVYEALYIESNVSSVDWEAIAKSFNPSAELIAANTSTAARYSVKVEAK
jgi:hypothetical protein